MRLKTFFILFLIILACTGCGTQKTETETDEQTEDFIEKMDKTKRVTLYIVGPLEELPGISEAARKFQEIYPRCVIEYEQAEQAENESYCEALSRRIVSKENIDLYLIQASDLKNNAVVADNCENLQDIGMNLDRIATEVLYNSYMEGELKSIPLASNACGLIVNITLLETLGLSAPQNYKELLEVCSKLKDKGYTPIGGAEKNVYMRFFQNEYMVRIGRAENAGNCLSNLEFGTEGSSEELRHNFEILTELVNNDYIKPKQTVFASSDDATHSFLWGEFPFLVAKASKMEELRVLVENLSDFRKDPFTYAFCYAPLLENGCCAYKEPWYGISVFEHSYNAEWANEFLRFLVNDGMLEEVSQKQQLFSVLTDGDKSFGALYPVDQTYYEGERYITRNLDETFGKQMKKVACGELTIDNALTEMETILAEKLWK